MKRGYNYILSFFAFDLFMSQLKVPTSFLEELSHSLEGEFYFDELFRTLYATDASVYREKPIGVAVPKNTADLKKLIEFAPNSPSFFNPKSGWNFISWSSSWQWYSGRYH